VTDCGLSWNLRTLRQQWRGLCVVMKVQRCDGVDCKGLPVGSCHDAGKEVASLIVENAKSVI